MPPPARPTASKPSPSTTTTPTAATSTAKAPRPRSPETHASLALRNQAAEILQSYEQLSWYALDRNEVCSSLPKPKSNPQAQPHPQSPRALKHPPLTFYTNTVPIPNPPALPLPPRRFHPRRRSRASRLENGLFAARAGRRAAGFDLYWFGAFGWGGEEEE